MRVTYILAFIALALLLNAAIATAKSHPGRKDRVLPAEKAAHEKMPKHEKPTPEPLVVPNIPKSVRENHKDNNIVPIPVKVEPNQHRSKRNGAKLDQELVVDPAVVQTEEVLSTAEVKHREVKLRKEKRRSTSTVVTGDETTTIKSHSKPHFTAREERKSHSRKMEEARNPSASTDKTRFRRSEKREQKKEQAPNVTM